MTTKKTADSQAVVNKKLADRIEKALLKHAAGKLALTPLQLYAARIIRARLTPNLRSVELIEKIGYEPITKIVHRIIYPGDVVTTSRTTDDD
ncbi:hypothetical protein [Pseudomonas sp. S2_B07]